MRRSREIPACLLLVTSAAAFSGCNERRDCVDTSGHKLPDSACQDASHPAGAHFIYGGVGGRSMGDRVSGGSDSPSVSRGGFGSGGEGSSAGGGEGGGE